MKLCFKNFFIVLLIFNLAIMQIPINIFAFGNKSHEELSVRAFNNVVRNFDLSEFAEIVPQNQILYVFADEPLMSGVSRQWLMQIRRDLMCRKLLKNKTISDLRRDNTIELVYFNNSFEAAVFFPLFREKKTIVHIHDMVDMFRPAHKKCVLESCENAAG